MGVGQIFAHHLTTTCRCSTQLDCRAALNIFFLYAKGSETRQNLCYQPLLQIFENHL